MAKTKNKKADKPIYSGSIMFDGNMQVCTARGEYRTIRTDLGGMQLQRANPNKELLVLTRDHVGYNEIDTGYIVRSKQYDTADPPRFGLKSSPDSECWGVFNYCDVIAWGYADGGLNDPTLYYSCQSTVEEEQERERRRSEKGMKTHAQKLAELDAELEAKLGERPEGLVVKLRDTDDSIDVETSWPKAKLEDYLPFVKNDLADCYQTFHDFREIHPDFHEMHFFTEQTVWEKDFENVECDESGVAN